MKRIVSIVLLLSVCVSATWASAAPAAVSFVGEGDTLSQRRFSFTLEGSLAGGLNGFSQRGAQVEVSAGLSFGRFMSVHVGIGVRYVYGLVVVDQNIHGYGEPDQHTYGDRLLLPFFVRVKGVVPAGSFSWAGASFQPYARLDVGYGVDLQQSLVSTRRPDAGGPFLLPAVGLDMRMADGSAWSFSLGVGIHAAKYVEVDHAGQFSEDLYTHTPATGKAVTLNFVLGRRF